ncbi:Hypothetical protein PFR_JS25-2_6 [Propionibacterium freudenreichii]|nr:Hypothetical protein PFR_JS25-2_6 [Propionibacterium freudenreichii]
MTTSYPLIPHNGPNARGVCHYSQHFLRCVVAPNWCCSISWCARFAERWTPLPRS